jgi:transposase
VAFGPLADAVLRLILIPYNSIGREEDWVLIIGIDPHKATHTAAAVDDITGQLLGNLTIDARQHGFEQLLGWAREHNDDRRWAIEDGRHVSGGLERFLLGAGEQVVRVPPKLMATERKTTRQFGKSDPIDALSTARAALREPDLPAARLAGHEHEIALLANHRDSIIQDAARHARRLRWLLHDLDPELAPAPRSLRNVNVLDQLSRRLKRQPPSIQLRICRELIATLKAATKHAAQLEREMAVLVRRHAPALLTIPGCGTLTAARILAEVDGIDRFRDQARLASYAGISPLEASSGKNTRHRLNRSGNRRLNRSLHIIAVTQARVHPPAKAYLARRLTEGKTSREALRALKRHLIRVIYRTLTRTTPTTPLTT